MAYVTGNPKTKKELKARVANGLAPDVVADLPTVFSPGPLPCVKDGVEFVEGPHYPEPHRWYAKVQVEDGRIVKVLG